MSVSSALTQALWDLFFCVLDASVSGWQESANLSRAFSQFFWDFEVVIEMLSKDMAAPAPKPDWDFLILSSIYKRKTENQISRLLHNIVKRQSTRRMPPDCLTGSFIPVPSLPSPSPFFQPIFSNIFRPLLTSLISL